MLHKDKIVIQKVVSEIEIGTELLGNTSYENFISNEMLKRAICMTVDFPLLLQELKEIEKQN